MDHSFERLKRVWVRAVLLRCSAAVLAPVCVIVASWGVRADAPPDRYMINSSQGLVTDLRTGLVWQQPISAMQYTWDAANTYCRSLSIGGMTGFRIPSL